MVSLLSWLRTCQIQLPSERASESRVVTDAPVTRMAAVWCVALCTLMLVGKLWDGRGTAPCLGHATAAILLA